jgi:BirA family biotin operon repressor/biotin-[acetyl-CoA-carboxylase] ligase
MYDLNLINEYLMTNYIGRTIMQFDELKSTYIKAKSIFNSCPDGTVILCENQTNCIIGFGNEWHSFPEKNVYLSIILKSNTLKYMASRYEIIAAASICKSVEYIFNNLECNFKWPNDILVNDKKISSVCCELMKIKNNDIGIIINICVNVNSDKNDIDEKLNATSLKIESKKNVDREMLIGCILNNFEMFNDEHINQGEIDSSRSVCIEKSKIINNYIKINKIGKKTVRKVYVNSIDENGNLIVVNDKGDEEIISSGEVTVKYE